MMMFLALELTRDSMKADDTPLTVETSELLAKLIENLDFQILLLKKAFCLLTK